MQCAVETCHFIVSLANSDRQLRRGRRVTGELAFLYSDDDVTSYKLHFLLLLLLYLLPPNNITLMFYYYYYCFLHNNSLSLMLLLCLVYFSFLSNSTICLLLISVSVPWKEGRVSSLFIHV